MSELRDCRCGHRYWHHIAYGHVWPNGKRYCLTCLRARL